MIVIIQVVPHCTQPNNVSYILIPPWRTGQRVTRFQEENVGTTLHLFQIIPKRTPAPERAATHIRRVRATTSGKSGKAGGSLGASPQQEVS